MALKSGEPPKNEKAYLVVAIATDHGDRHDILVCRYNGGGWIEWPEFTGRTYHVRFWQDIDFSDLPTLREPTWNTGTRNGGEATLD